MEVALHLLDLAARTSSIALWAVAILIRSETQPGPGKPRETKPEARFMKPLDAESDAYGLTFVEARKSILETTKNVPWVDIRLEYNGLFRQVWIWVLVEDVEHARSTYDCLVGAFRILDIDENRCDLNLTILCRLPGKKNGYIATLSGKQDVIDFNHQQVSERDMTIVSDAWQPSVFSESS